MLFVVCWDAQSAVISNNSTGCVIFYLHGQIKGHTETFKKHEMTKEMENMETFALHETKYGLKWPGLTSIQSSVTKTSTTRTFLHVLLQMVDADAESIHQIYSLPAHVWESLEDDLHVCSLSKLINPSLPINLLVPLPVWRQMCRTESDLLCSRPDVERIQNDSQHQPLTYTGRWLLIDFHGGVHYKTDGVIF